MYTHRFSIALVLFTTPWLTLACASDPQIDTWKVFPDPSAAPEGSPVAIHGQLQVVGTQLLDHAGAPIQLKGVSSMWLNAETLPFAESKQALAYMRDQWKLSVIRAAMPTGNPSGLQAKVDRIVQHAIDLGVYVLVDWHTEDAVSQQDQAVAFFATMATKYGAYPNVIWEPYNEPSRFTWAQIKPYHEAVVAAIRAVDPDNLIVLGTPNWSQYVDEAALDPVAGTNLLYTLHFYSCTHTQWLRDRGNTAIAAGLPLFVSEFGATYSDGGLAPDHDYVCEDEANLWFAWMAQNNISGVAWKLEQCTDASCILGFNAPLGGPWPDNVLSTDVGGAVSGTGIKGGHGLFVVKWIRQ
jgi:aryl-phospho-beta-D-glucosidase BglC (GH1 family)